MISVGVDRGGSRLRVRAVNGRGRLIRRHDGPAPADLTDALKRLWDRWGLENVGRLVVGSRGIWTPPERTALRRKLAPLAGKVVVISDAELAWVAARWPGAAGVLLIAGTGSMALGRTPAGRWFRAGGRGPQKGDEGSGFWIAREYLRRAGPYAGETVSRLAARTPAILARATRDARAQKVIEEAHVHLAGLLARFCRKSNWTGPLPVALAGGLFTNFRFRQGFQRRVARELYPRRPLWIPRRQDTALVAARLTVAQSRPLPRGRSLPRR
jgi:N-acetylglucosamine kinase-like BadF-type ATPase